MLVTGDLGFSSLVLVVCFAFSLLAFLVRRRWSLAAARNEEIKRLLVLASEEAARAEIEASASYSNASPPVSQGYYCAVCYCPTTTRCAQCKAVRYCSGKCQIVHWRQGHKEECHPVEAGSHFDGKDNRSGQDTYYGETLESKAKQCAKPNVSFSDERVRAQSSCSEILRAKDNKISIELRDVNFSSESSDASPGFTSSTTNSDSSDDTSVCESINSDDSGRLEEPLSSGIAHKISGTGGIKIEEQAGPLSPKFASLVDSLGSFGSSSKLHQSKSGCIDDQVQCRSSGDSHMGCSGLHKDSMAEPSRDSSGFWNSLNHPRNVVRDDSSHSGISNTGACGKPDSGSTLRFSFKLSSNSLCPVDRQDSEISAKKPENRSALSETPNADGSSAPQSPSTKSECPSHAADEGCKNSHVSKFSASESLSSVKANVANVTPSKTAPSSRVNAHKSKCSEAGCILPSDFDVHGKSGPNLHSTSCTKLEKACGGYTHAPLSSHVAAHLPNTKTGLKTSVWKVLDQFKGSVMSKHQRSGVGSDIPGRCNDKGIFPYELFVTLYTWKGVELHPRGLINCGNSCYANAVLQCLAFTPPLTAYFLQGLHSKACVRKDWCFTCEFENLILKMNEGKSPISPIGIVSQLRNIGRQLGNGKEEDAHEFLRCAIDKMQSDCLVGSGKKVSRSKEEATLIGLTFGGYLRSKIQCTKCNGKSERHERMMDLTVEIGGDIRTLEEALRQFTSTETLDGENKYQCTRCNSYEKARKKLSVLEAPNILTIALKRFQSGKFGKLNKSIQFSEILDLAPFMKGTSDRSAVYRLYGVIVHLDIMNAAFSGHYVCYVKNMHNKWFKIDDSTAKPVELERVLTKGAYMLLYARCLPRAPRSLKDRVTSADPRNKPMNVKSSGKSATLKSGLTNLRNHHHSSACMNDSASAHSFDLDINPLQRYHREDSSSDVSSLFSSNSDEGSCSTISTQDSPSYDDLTDYIFGDSGSSWSSSPWSNPSESNPSLSSPFCLRH